MKAMFPDSTIAQIMQLKRTKYTDTMAKSAELMAEELTKN